MLIRSDPSWEDHIPLITAGKCAVKDIVREQLVPKKDRITTTTSLTFGKAYYHTKDTIYRDIWGEGLLLKVADTEIILPKLSLMRGCIL